MSKNGKKHKEKKAFGLIDRIVNKMPEIHIPGYQYCGPGTRLAERLARGEPGINKLDAACKVHDLAYASCEDTKSRRKADKELIARAFKRIYSDDAKLDERAAALLVSGLMGAKIGLTKIGLGIGVSQRRNMKRKSRVSRKQRRIKRKNHVKRKTITFGKLVNEAKNSVKKSKKKSTSLNSTIIAAIRSVQGLKRSKKVKLPRVLKLPKFGAGAHTILPILSGLSAIGAIKTSAAAVVKAINDIENAKKQYISGVYNTNDEKKIGHGLNLIYKTGKTACGTGFYLKPYHQQQQQHQHQQH